MEETPFTLRFKLGSIPVEIQPWFWLMAAVLGGNMLGPRILIWILVVFVSVLVHELGHALAVLAFGGRARILLYSFGGLTFPSRRFSKWKDIAMSVAGPGAGFLLAALVFGVTRFNPPLTDVGWWTVARLIEVNVAWGILNLLPVPPLDGGHVTLSLVGPRHERKALYFGAAVAALIAVYFLTHGSLYTVVLFGMLAFQNFQKARG